MLASLNVKWKNVNRWGEGGGGRGRRGRGVTGSAGKNVVFHSLQRDRCKTQTDGWFPLLLKMPTSVEGLPAGGDDKK